MTKVSLSVVLAALLLSACGENSSIQVESNPTPAPVVQSSANTASGEVAAENNENAMIAGSVFYRERIALPEGSTLRVQLLDVSRQDVAATTIGEVVYDDIGAPPYNFEINYDSSQIDQRMRYSLRAEIRNGEQLLFTTTQHYPVLTGEDNGEPKLLLQSVAAN